jgi:hypothetical protein
MRGFAALRAGNLSFWRRWADGRHL